MSVNDATRPVIQLAERAHEVIEVTELEPNNGTFIGKHINPDGSITQYPKNIAWWRQRVAQVPATVPAVFAYLHATRTRNVCLIRGTPADVDRLPTRRQKAGVAGGRDRGDHGFLDLPTKFMPLDVDGAKMAWKADPEGAVRAIVAQLGEPWASASFMWFFSATHGLELDAHKRWTRRISDGVVRVRLVFIAERALDEGEAVALTRIAKAHSKLPLDESIVRCVQPNYIKRPHWVSHPERDVLGDIPTIGWVRGARDHLAVPDDLRNQARWAKAQGRHADIADHPDAETAVRGIGSDGAVRSHLMAAVQHLLLANPTPDPVSFLDHAMAIVRQLGGMVERHRAEIEGNLAAFGRSFRDVLQYLPDNMVDWAHWLLDHPSALKRKTVKLTREERAEAEAAEGKAEATYARVTRVIEAARKGEAVDDNAFVAFVNEGMPPVVLLVAPPGSRKSTLMRAAAVAYLEEHPDETVVILVPYHDLSDEQLERMRKEHPGVDAAVWRGRHRDDPDEPGKKMCWRSEEAAELEEALIDVERHLCKQGRGKKAVKCPFYELCGYQRQKLIEARIWFAAHECAVHKMPKGFGKVGWVLIDESPLDAFLLGVDGNDPMTLELDALRTPPTALTGTGQILLMLGREALYQALDRLKVPIDPQRGVPAARAELHEFLDQETLTMGRRSIRLAENDPRRMRALEWRDKVNPKIRPDMSARQVREALAAAAGNARIKKLVTLWQLVGEGGGGRIQVHRGKEGRIIRMVGLRELAKGWNVQTLILDATGDVELLRAIWPQLEQEDTQAGWQQLPRPPGVQLFQVVDRSLAKYAVAVEAKNPKEMARKVKSARELYGTMLAKAAEYGGAAVGLITYKSTRKWIEENCCVPPWLRLFHFGALVGSNALASVRALFVVGRPLASPEDVTRQAEALFGAFILEREYSKPRKTGRIPIVPDADGNNTILVDVREHPDPVAERMRRQITEAALIQAVGRARAGLRGADEPLDVHLWTDVPLPELGPVEPVLWNELDAGLDGAMLAAGGMWLESVPHAAEAYQGLFTAAALKQARKRNERAAPIGTLSIRYQRAGQGQQTARAAALLDPAAARAWLTDKLSPLVQFEVEAAAARPSEAGRAL